MFSKNDKIHKRSLKKMDTIVTGILLGWVVASIYGIKKTQKHLSSKNIPEQHAPESQLRKIIKMLIFGCHTPVVEKKQGFFARLLRNKYMKKRRFYLSFCVWTVIIGGIFSPIFAAWATYTSEIDICRKANADGRAKTIEDYICPVGILTPQQIAFQVVMSLEFNKLDRQVKKDLESIYTGNNKDIGQLSTNIADLFDKTKNNALYPAQYEKVCNEIVIKEVASYFTEKNMKNNTNDTITTDNDASLFLFWQKWCQNLVDKKIQSYKDTAWLLGESAMVKSFKDDKHEYMRKLKDQYEKFLNKWITYLGQLGVIKDKWPSKSKKVQ